MDSELDSELRGVKLAWSKSEGDGKKWNTGELERIGHPVAIESFAAIVQTPGSKNSYCNWTNLQAILFRVY